MSVDRLQQLLDALGNRLQRSVAVDDHMLNLLAVGEDFGDSDPARMWSLLHRRTRPEDVDYARLRTAPGPTWTQPNEELGLVRRLCAPIRHDGMLLGLLWVIDRDGSLDDAQVEEVSSTATALGVVLRQRMLITDRDSALMSYLLGEVVADDRRRSAQAATDLRQHGFVTDDAHVGVLVVDAGTGADEHPTALSDAVARAGRTLPPGGWLASVTARRATVLLAGPRPVDAELGAAADRLVTLLGPDRGSWWVAVGGATQGLAGAPTSRYQAVVALSVARRLEPDVGGARSVAWAELGPYRLIGQLPETVLAAESLPLGLFNLLRSDNSANLVETAERFLDCAGDKQRTARELGIHRTTLYYRLDRIEAVTGMDLAAGVDRLLLHLAVKLYRLSALADGPARLSDAAPAHSSTVPDDPR